MLSSRHRDALLKILYNTVGYITPEQFNGFLKRYDEHNTIDIKHNPNIKLVTDIYQAGIQTYTKLLNRRLTDFRLSRFYYISLLCHYIIYLLSFYHFSSSVYRFYLFVSNVRKQQSKNQSVLSTLGCRRGWVRKTECGS